MIWPTDDDAIQITKNEWGLIVAPRGGFELLIGGTDYYSQEVGLTRPEAIRLHAALEAWLDA